VRTGGSFVWPPPESSIAQDHIDQVLLVAGGVGINPLISIFAHLISLPHRPRKIKFVYASRVQEKQGLHIQPSKILFLTRIMRLIEQLQHAKENVQLHLFLTATTQEAIDASAKDLPTNVKLGRIAKQDLETALGEDRGVREATVAYVCGPPAMTDQFVEVLASLDGMTKERVLCEKWW
jgi:NAD(P)H-flavin reductase